MKKPKNFELKKWLSENIIVGLKIHCRQIGSEETETKWELIPNEGKSKQILDTTIKSLVDVRPDWIRCVHVKREVYMECVEWEKYAGKEADDLAEYERLKKKFA